MPRKLRDGGRSRDAFLDTTARLLRRQGYAATGLNEIVDRSGAPKGSLYFHFPRGKEQLAAAAMGQSGAQLQAAIAATLGSAEDLAIGIGWLLDVLAAGLEASGYRDGCPIATVTLEAAAQSEELRGVAEEAFESWLAVIQEHLQETGLQAAPARRRALFVLSAIEGALILARAQQDTAPLKAARDELVALVA